MRTIRWRFTVEPNTQGSNFQADTVKIAFARIQRYWNVNFVQQSQAVNLTFQLTRRTKGSAAMWQSGAVIFIAHSFRWGTSQAARQQMALTACHEIGHWIIQGNGRDGHAPPGNVMSALVTDPFQNWTQTDMRWFGSLPWKTGLRPWQEPNYFRDQFNTK